MTAAALAPARCRSCGDLLSEHVFGYECPNNDARDYWDRVQADAIRDSATVRPGDATRAHACGCSCVLCAGLTVRQRVARKGFEK